VERCFSNRRFFGFYSAEPTPCVGWLRGSGSAPSLAGIVFPHECPLSCTSTLGHVLRLRYRRCTSMAMS
jgi:hypothetical protein